MLHSNNKHTIHYYNEGTSLSIYAIITIYLLFGRLPEYTDQQYQNRNIWILQSNSAIEKLCDTAIEITNFEL
jgi:hypothetical protein